MIRCGSSGFFPLVELDADYFLAWQGGRPIGTLGQTGVDRLGRKAMNSLIFEPALP